MGVCVRVVVSAVGRVRVQLCTVGARLWKMAGRTMLWLSRSHPTVMPEPHGMRGRMHLHSQPAMTAPEPLPPANPSHPATLCDAVHLLVLLLLVHSTSALSHTPPWQQPPATHPDVVHQRLHKPRQHLVQLLILLRLAPGQVNGERQAQCEARAGSLVALPG